MRAAAAPYPAAAALRRRQARQQAAGEAFPAAATTTGTATGAARPAQQQQQQPTQLHVSQLYCLLSALAAFLAIVTAPSASSSALNHPPPPPSLFLVESVQDLSSLDATNGDVASSSSIQPQQQGSMLDYESLDLFKSVRGMFYGYSSNTEVPDVITTKKESKKEQRASKQQQQQQHQSSSKFRWMSFSSPENNGDAADARHSRLIQNPILRFFLSFLDPSILHPTSTTITDLIDKVLTSTPRLLAIANWLLSITFLLHTAIVDLFLGGSGMALLQTNDNATATAAMDDVNRNNVSPNNPSLSWAGRGERLGGFLVFKLLLVSAVVAPDTLDLMILLSWYTLLSFLRSLAHLCSATTAHTASSGQGPPAGVKRLLWIVLWSDALAATVCVALFHGAGWGMVLLLTCDCALLASDTICHLMRHASQAMEERHSAVTREMEERQVQLHQEAASRRRNNNETVGNNNDSEEEEEPATEWTSHSLQQPQPLQVDDGEEDESRALDRRMEVLERSHGRKLAILDTCIFSLELVTHLLTVAHFLHIWSLHGLQFTLIDGVLCLHLHSAVSAAAKKIAERRNLNRISRALDGLFQDATELEMRKALACGDVCCICLGTMSAGPVKKVACGHLYHTQCLRQVVERARSMEAARCPLCRASVMDGRQFGNGGGNTTNNTADNTNNNNEQPPQQDNNERGPVQGEHALFRFSTENILPAWLPLPAFSFEVVRRPTTTNAAAAAAAAAAVAAENTNNNNNTENNNNNHGHEPSFWRRLLQMAGAIPMSPEEEARALTQLVDMFPQHNRADLQRELRNRGSAEAVVESILQGVFAGVPRGGGGVAPVMPQDRIQQQQQQEQDDNSIVERDNEETENAILQ